MLRLRTLVATGALTLLALGLAGCESGGYPPALQSPLAGTPSAPTPSGADGTPAPVSGLDVDTVISDTLAATRALKSYHFVRQDQLSDGTGAHSEGDYTAPDKYRAVGKVPEASQGSDLITIGDNAYARSGGGAYKDLGTFALPALDPLAKIIRPKQVLQNTAILGMNTVKGVQLLHLQMQYDVGRLKKADLLVDPKRYLIQHLEIRDVDYLPTGPGSSLTVLTVMDYTSFDVKVNPPIEK